MNQPLRVLIIEDAEDDALLLVRELRHGGLDPTWTRVCTAADTAFALRQQAWDVVICDYAMPSFNALDALRLVEESGQDVPFIVVSGAIGEQVAVGAMKAGAHDYLMKDNLARLIPALARELKEAEERRERRRAEAALRQAQKTESLGVMAGGIAHDFNNLLVALLAQSSLALAKLPPGSPARDHVEKAIKAAERAADLTRQMLNYAGGGPTRVEAIDLNQLVEENLSLLAAALPKNVRLDSRLARHLAPIQGDRGQVQQVIMNLILNAAEALQEAPGVIWVGTSLRQVAAGDGDRWAYVEDPPASGPHVELTVSDDGVGMDEATLARIFDPFYTTKKHGRGLGLAAVLGIVRSHRGSLEVTSQLGAGTTFRVLWPASAPVAAAQMPREAEKRDRESWPGGAVLVIDDEEPIRLAVSDILAFSGIEVLTAANGTEGIDLFRQRCTDIKLVLLDLSMPGLSGEETLQALLRLDSEVHVIVSSGYDRSEATSRLGPNWQVEFLQKPYSFDDLLRSVLAHATPVISTDLPQATEPARADSRAGHSHP